MSDNNRLCVECGARLDVFDVGCYKKLVNRGAQSFLCRGCLSVRLNCTRASIDAMIVRFQRQGCTLFPPIAEDQPIN